MTWTQEERRRLEAWLHNLRLEPDIEYWEQRVPRIEIERWLTLSTLRTGPGPAGPPASLPPWFAAQSTSPRDISSASVSRQRRPSEPFRPASTSLELRPRRVPPSDPDGHGNDDDVHRYGNRTLRLGNGEFRLLTIHPGAAYDTLKCDLRIYRSFTKCPPFEALSYAWGNPENAGDVHVRVFKHDGSTTVKKEDLRRVPSHVRKLIYRYIYDNLHANDWSAEDAEVVTDFWRFSGCTKNCENALRRLRKAERPRTVWVDAICINQKDSVERTRQVQIMGQIYHYAEQAVAYSGHTTKPTWNTLLHQPYFGRLWPVQELLHAKKIRLYYGSSSVDWDTLSKVYDLRRRKTRSDVSPTGAGSQTSTAASPSNFFEL